MQTKLLFAAAAAVFLMGAAPAADGFVHYRASPVVEGGALTSIAVEMRFTGDADGETRLHLPDRWAGETEYFKHLRDLSIEGATAREDGPAWRVLTHAPGAALTVRYRVLSAYDADPQVGRTNGNPYRPIIRPQWFSAIGHGLFAEPEGGVDRPADFRWGEVPAGWKVASDLDHSQWGARLSVGDVQQSVMLGGPGLRVYVQPVKGADVRLAVLGEWPAFKAEDFSTLIARVLRSQRDYWKAPGETYFVALTPLTPQEGSISLGGTGLDDGFALYAGTDTPLEPMRYLLAHEHMHTWVPRRLGRMPEGEQEAADYWFSEGFTDFMTHRTLLRSGVWSLEDYVEKLNEELHAYAVSSSRTAPNSEIVKRFWSDGEVQKLPYRRGMLLALLWDFRLRQATRGAKDMDDVLERQQDLASQARARFEDPRAAELFPVAYRALGGDLGEDIARQVERGEAVLLPQSLFGACATVETVRRARFARGWDAEATTRNGNVVTGLRDDSPAFAAGLRNGMQIVRREFGEPGNSTVEYGLRVKDGDGERVIRFMPTAPGFETVQKVVLAPGMGAARKAACARSMSGA